MRLIEDRNLRVLLYSVILLLCATDVSCVAKSPTAKVSVDTIFSDYLTPLMFGARGDGKHDDTDAIRKALYESNMQGKVLYFPSGYTFKVTGTLNYFDKAFQSYTLNLMGCVPIKKGSYVPTESGGIIVDKGVSLFKSATIGGSLERVSVTGKRDMSVRFFDHCECKGLVMHGCNISNFGVLFSDTPVNTVSQITQNTFLTLYYFSKNEDTSSGLTDSTISLNYINGGMEQNDNSCFEWAYYNGSIISSNFIDYYRTIYFPKATKKQTFVGPLSYSNQYQVFRYFYAAGTSNFSSFTFSSTADSFNWNDPSTLEKLQKYEALTYHGKDGKEYEIPPYVAICHSTWNVSVHDAKIERNMGPLVFVYSSLTEYEYNRFEVSFVGNNQFKKGQINYKQGDSKPFYNNGKYPQNEMKIEGIVEVLDALPDSSVGWSSSVQGRTVQVNGQQYRSKNVFDGRKWKNEWSIIKN